MAPPGREKQANSRTAGTRVGQFTSLLRLIRGSVRKWAQPRGLLLAGKVETRLSPESLEAGSPAGEPKGGKKGGFQQNGTRRGYWTRVLLPRALQRVPGHYSGGVWPTCLSYRPVV